MPAKPKPKPKPDTLVAATGLEYLGTDGKSHRVEAGKPVKAADISPQALDWMTSAGFLVPEPQEGDD